MDAVGIGGSTWRLRRLPRDGGIEDQDAWLWSALVYTRGVANELLAEDRDRGPESDEAAHRKWHDEQVKRKARTH